MKQGRAAGSYFLYILREGLFRLKELWSWKGLVVIAIGLYMVLGCLTEDDGFSMNFQGMGLLWLVVLFPPRMGKLLYLLPFSKKERKRYLANYTLIYWLFLVMVLLVIGGTASLISGNSLLLWIRDMVVYTGPFMLAYSSGMLSAMVTKDGKTTFQGALVFGNRMSLSGEQNVGVTGTEEKNRGKKLKNKEEIVKSAILFFCVFLVAIHCFFPEFIWFIFGKKTVVILTSMMVAYLGAVVVGIMSFSEVSKELNSKDGVGKEECACNS